MKAYLYSKRLEIGVLSNTQKGSRGFTHDMTSGRWWEWGQPQPSPEYDSSLRDQWVDHPNPDDLWTRYCAAVLSGTIGKDYQS